MRVPELDRLGHETYLASSGGDGGGGHRTDIWNWRETWPADMASGEIVEDRETGRNDGSRARRRFPCCPVHMLDSVERRVAS
jgi:hypothetical protein